MSQPLPARDAHRSAPFHLVFGAGPVGTAVATQLAGRGERVVLASRSGRGPDLPGIARASLDAADPEATTRAAEGAVVLYNCLNPTAYHRWPQLWPPMATALLDAAERAGAVLATVSNLYAYGPPDGPMTESSPQRPSEPKGAVRLAMWLEAKARHDAGRVRVVELRGSDYVGAGVGAGGHLTRHAPRIRAGKAVRVVGSPDQPHTWTDVTDMARALVIAGADERAWGRFWHVPSSAPCTQREGIADLAAAAGVAPVKVGSMPTAMLRAVGLVTPSVRELARSAYQFERAFVMDSSAFTTTFGLVASPWEESCRASMREATTG